MHIDAAPHYGLRPGSRYILLNARVLLDAAEESVRLTGEVLQMETLGRFVFAMLLAYIREIQINYWIS